MEKIVEYIKETGNSYSIYENRASVGLFVENWLSVIYDKKDYKYSVKVTYQTNNSIGKELIYRKIVNLILDK